MKSYIIDLIKYYEQTENNEEILETLNYELKELNMIFCSICNRKDYPEIMIENKSCICCFICHDCYDTIQRQQEKIKSEMIYNYQIYGNYNKLTLGVKLKCNKMFYTTKISENELSNYEIFKNKKNNNFFNNE